MSKVVSLAEAKKERGPHCNGTAICLTCNHEWEGVWPVGEVALECPSCHSERGRSKFDVVPAVGSQVWECTSCGNQLFNLLPDRVHCPGCGQQWDYGQLAT